MAQKEVYIKTYQKTKTHTNSLTFDGVNDYVTMGNAIKYQFERTQTFTIEAWIYITAIGAERIIVSKLLNSGTFAGYEFNVTSTGALFFYAMNNFGTNMIAVASTTTVRANTWTHVAVTYNGDSNANNVQFYINGILSAKTINTNNLTASILSTAIVSVGSRNAIAGFFIGQQQEVRIWNTVRTAQQIVNNMFTSLAGTETGLVGYYKLNEGTGTTATDSASSPVNGTLTSFPASPWSTSLISPLYQRTYKGVSIDYTFDSITGQVNSGYGALTFTIPREFDVLKSQDPQNLENYELDVIAYNNQQSLGVTLFSGDVVIDNRKLSGSSESVVYTAISPLERIEKIDLIGTTPVVTYTSTEIATIFRDIIDKCNARAKEQILKYTATSIATTGESLTTTFRNVFVGDALKSVFKATNSDWVWYIDVDRTVYLKEISITPNHYFFNTKDISSVERVTDKTKIVNTLKVWDGDTNPTVLREYVNQSSIDIYGLRVEAIQDGRFTTTAGALKLGTREITTNKLPNDELEFTIIDSSGGGYDIDSIKLGDTFKALNFNTQTNLPSLMVVTSKTDFLDYCVIKASDRADFVARELVALKKEQFQVNNSDHPNTAYTIVNV
jgi:hypothetical protein